MTNMQTLINSENESEKIFGTTIDGLKSCQGFYTRLYNNIDTFDSFDFKKLRKEIVKQNFKDSVDVVLYLEC